VARAIEVLRAVLTFDSLTSPLPAAVRTAEGSRISALARRLLYSAGDYDIDLAVERSATRRGRPCLRGQILARAPRAGLPDGSEARLRRAGGRSAVIPLDAHGAFESGPLDPGRYRLTVRGGAVEIIVDRLDMS